MPHRAVAGAGAAFFEKDRKADLARTEHRSHCAGESDSEVEDRSEEQDGQIETGFTEARDAARSECLHCAQAEPREKDSKRSTQETKKESLRDELACKSAAPRSDRGANGDLASARRRADEQQAANVRTGEEKDEADGAHQQNQLALDITGSLLREELCIGTKVVFRTGIGFRQALEDGIEIGTGTGECDSGFEQGESANCAVQIALRKLCGRWAKRQVKVHVPEPKAGIATEYANDGDRISVEPDGFADDIRIGAESLLPELWRQHHR